MALDLAHVCQIISVTHIPDVDLNVYKTLIATNSEHALTTNVRILALEFVD